MKAVRAKIPLPYRLILIGALLTSWTTGITIYILQKWVRVQGEFGLTYHPFQSDSRQIHGAAAFAMMIIYGYLLASHVPYGWKQQRQRKLGLLLLGLQFLLILSGYIIYYTANETLQHFTATAHIITGLTFPLILIAHIALALKARASMKSA
jgi:hypothetical protein